MSWWRAFGYTAVCGLAAWVVWQILRPSYSPDEKESEMEPKYQPVKKGLKGTDNCPTCGKAMERIDNATVLVCDDGDHIVVSILRPPQDA